MAVPPESSGISSISAAVAVCHPHRQLSWGSGSLPRYSILIVREADSVGCDGGPETRPKLIQQSCLGWRPGFLTLQDRGGGQNE